ncbi:MAG: methyltransferase domain-containing protein [candidate division Zixibacteria bacterium]|nr:methyltransferase domain-containing protein [candidate division Zixibacteria bacterium]
MPKDEFSRYIKVEFKIPLSEEGRTLNLLEELGFTGAETGLGDDDILFMKAYFPENLEAESLKKELSKFLQGLYADFGSRYQGPIDFSNAGYTDWEKLSHENYLPVREVPKLVILAPWDEPDQFSEEIKLIINPGMTFGTGQHPSTILALRALRKFVRPGIRTLDYGTGTGILAIYALKLGAEYVIGYDNYPGAIESALENTKINHIDRGYKFTIDKSGFHDSSFDIVAANLDLKTITASLSELIGLTADKGKLILSGIEQHESDTVGELLRVRGIDNYETNYHNDWVAFIIEV